METTELKNITRLSENWHYWKGNAKLPVSISKYFSNDYYELKERKKTDFGTYSISTVAYFDTFDDAKNFIFNAYELNPNDCYSPIPRKLKTYCLQTNV